MNGMILSVNKELSAFDCSQIRRCELNFLFHSPKKFFGQNEAGVEVAGVEPASEVKIHKTSTHIVCFILGLESCKTDQNALSPACFIFRFICTSNRIGYHT